MAALPIHETGGLLKSEIELRDQKVAEDAARGRRRITRVIRKDLSEMGDRMTKVEQEVTTVKQDVAAVKCDVADVKNDVAEVKGLAQHAVSQNTEILAAFQALKGEVEETREETAEGVKITKKVTRIGETAKDLHLDKAWEKAWPWLAGVMGVWGSSHLLAWLFGPEIRDAILKRVLGH